MKPILARIATACHFVQGEVWREAPNEHWETPTQISHTIGVPQRDQETERRRLGHPRRLLIMSSDSPAGHPKDFRTLVGALLGVSYRRADGQT